MAKKTTVKNVRNANIPEKLRKTTHQAAPTSPGTMSRVWQTVKKLWVAAKGRGGRSQYSQVTSIRVSKELDIDLEKVCDATKNLSDEGYLALNARGPRSSGTYKPTKLLFCRQKIKPIDLDATYQES